MKKITLLLAMAAFVTSVFSQTLTLKVNGVDVNGSTITVSGPINEHVGEFKCYMDVINTSNSSVQVYGSKQQIKIQEGVESTFCWMQCVEGDTVGPITMRGEESSGKEFYGSVIPTIDIDLADLDTTIVKYKIWLTSNPADSVSVTIKYALGKEGIDVGIEKPTVKTKKTNVNAYSVSGSGVINFKYDLPNLKSGNLVLRNLNGVVISSQSIQGGSNSSTMNIKNLARGLYFYTIDNGGSIMHAGKVVVN